MIDAFPELKALFKLKSFDQKALDECIEIINKERRNLLGRK